MCLRARGARRQGFTLIELMIVIAIIAILAGILLPNMVIARDQAKFTSCQQNIRALASAMESYATDNDGRYPTNLTVLSPEFINNIPTCPVAGSRTPYLTGLVVASNPDAYTIFCAGSFHTVVKGVGANYPQYSADTGLIQR